MLLERNAEFDQAIRAGVLILPIDDPLDITDSQYREYRALVLFANDVFS